MFDNAVREIAGMVSAPWLTGKNFRKREYYKKSSKHRGKKSRLMGDLASSFFRRIVIKR